MGNGKFENPHGFAYTKDVAILRARLSALEAKVAEFTSTNTGKCEICAYCGKNDVILSGRLYGYKYCPECGRKLSHIA